MTKYKHLFFDMDETVAPARQPILPEMFDLLSNLEEDIIIVSGQSADKIAWQSNNLPAYILGQNGNEAFSVDGEELWNTPLNDNQRAEIMGHIQKLVTTFSLELNEKWNPIEDRGGQITFSPVGNTAPVEIKKAYDPDRLKRFNIMKTVPFVSDDLVVKIGGSTSLDYIHKDRHKGTNVQKLIDLKGWNKNECIYFGDGLYPGGNDEAVIGVIETVAVKDHLDTLIKLQDLLKK
jgi:HAD superfamily hydrolase (TIGR01484 family)